MQINVDHQNQKTHTPERALANASLLNTTAEAFVLHVDCIWLRERPLSRAVKRPRAELKRNSIIKSFLKNLTQWNIYLLYDLIQNCTSHCIRIAVYHDTD